jgi:hypothetical protein
VKPTRLLSAVPYHINIQALVRCKAFPITDRESFVFLDGLSPTKNASGDARYARI